MSHEPFPIEQRFWPKVDTSGECWLWKAATNGKYGVIGRGRISDGMTYAHRVSWEIANGRSVPIGMDVMHSCDTPLCVRPEHLSVGTRRENMRDASEKGRLHRDNSREKNPRSRMTEPLVAELRAMYSTGFFKQRDLALFFGIGQTQVSRIIRGEHWK